MSLEASDVIFTTLFRDVQYADSQSDKRSVFCPAEHGLAI
jgi:hypothetical protein